MSHELARRLQADISQTVIYNGAEPPRGPLTAPRPSPRGTPLNLVAVGRLEPVKGLGYLLEALAHPRLRDRIRLHLVGDGPEEAALRAQAQALGLSDRVHFHGFQAEAQRFIAQADLLVLPSLHEGVPYVLLEALWLGTPVLASAVGGIPEVVRHRREAWLVPPASAAELVLALRQLLVSPELRQRLRTAGWDRVSAAFSAGGMAQRYATLYARELAR